MDESFWEFQIYPKSEKDNDNESFLKSDVGRLVGLECVKEGYVKTNIRKRKVKDNIFNK